MDRTNPKDHCQRQKLMAMDFIDTEQKRTELSKNLGTTTRGIMHVPATPMR